MIVLTTHAPSPVAAETSKAEQVLALTEELQALSVRAEGAEKAAAAAQAEARTHSLAAAESQAKLEDTEVCVHTLHVSAR